MRKRQRWIFTVAADQRDSGSRGHWCRASWWTKGRWIGGGCVKATPSNSSRQQSWRSFISHVSFSFSSLVFVLSIAQRLTKPSWVTVTHQRARPLGGDKRSAGPFSQPQAVGWVSLKSPNSCSVDRRRGSFAACCVENRLVLWLSWCTWLRLFSILYDLKQI